MQPCSHTSQAIPDVLENPTIKTNADSSVADADEPAKVSDALAARSESGSAKISKSKDGLEQTQ